MFGPVTTELNWIGAIPGPSVMTLLALYDWLIVKSNRVFRLWIRFAVKLISMPRLSIWPEIFETGRGFCWRWPEIVMPPIDGARLTATSASVVALLYPVAWKFSAVVPDAEIETTLELIRPLRLEAVDCRCCPV